MEKDLTKGDIKKELISLSLPLIMGNILQQLYNTIDAIVVGRFVGSEAFAALSIAGNLMNFFIFLINGITAGSAIILSQSFGSGDLKAFRKTFFSSTLLGSLFTILLSIFAIFSIDFLLNLLNTPLATMDYAKSYLTMIYLGLIFSFIYHIASSALRAIGDTRSSLYFLLISMLINLILDLYFVVILKLGTFGAALATVIAEFISALLSILYISRKYPSVVFKREDAAFDATLAKKISRFSIVSALQMCSLYIGKLLVQGSVNNLGIASINAYAAALRIEGFANSFGDSGCNAMATFIGQNTGAMKKERIKDGIKIGEKLLFLFAIAVAFIMIVLKTPLLLLLLPTDEGLSEAESYLSIISFFYIFNFLGSGLSGYFQGRGKIALAVLGTSMHITLRVILSYLFAPKIGLSAIAIATALGWILVVIFWNFLRLSDLKNC